MRAGGEAFVDPAGGGDILNGRYRILELLGHGAMSTVCKARDEVLQRDVALKIFSPGSGDEGFEERQQAEMRLLAGFDHPGLVHIYDAGVDTGTSGPPQAFLVMELVSGHNLRSVLAEGPLSLAETTHIGHALAGALVQVHGRGVIHRDIKPANILVSETPGPDRIVKLADFGVARILEGSRLTATGMTVGTAQYLSPEQALGRPLTPASDIYSLGLVLLECLTGRAEYPGTPIESAAARLHRAPVIPEQIHHPIAELLKSMTDLEPANRSTAEEIEEFLGRPWQDAYAHAPTALLPPLPARSPAVPATSPMSIQHHKVGGRGQLGALLMVLLATAIAIPLAVALSGQDRLPADVTSPSPVTQQSDLPSPVGTPAPVVTITTPGPVETVLIPGPVQTVLLPPANSGNGPGGAPSSEVSQQASPTEVAQETESPAVVEPGHSTSAGAGQGGGQYDEKGRGDEKKGKGKGGN
ncbi:serine/threonine-protein kinase [Arthrobacter sp. StoSoilB5]|uniref:serine/threonine-protein kinase n=1 Tax=Arthrobacter sp. StoSoilB5 TaxID=2830992 RepID=UPI001CC7D9E3|nr:serine/threonine-protein kinase [Arthrobacter sp. StoSoilB5]BCW47462.1 serine/threonine protein kinase [Arthrobacter sp. StoSoilB5]